jgi:heat shock protein HslJ
VSSLVAEPTEDHEAERSLVGTTWQLEESGGELSGTIPTVTFDAGGRLHGHAGVNRLVGSYHVDGGTVEFSGVATTRMAGPEEAMRREHELLSVLSGTRSFSVADLLVVGEGAASAGFRRVVGKPSETSGREDELEPGTRRRSGTMPADSP